MTMSTSPSATSALKGYHHHLEAIVGLFFTLSIHFAHAMTASMGGSMLVRVGCSRTQPESELSLLLSVFDPVRTPLSK